VSAAISIANHLTDTNKYKLSGKNALSKPKQADIGVAQWLRCRPLAGGLHLPCARSMVDRWPLSTMGQSTRPTRPSIPPGSVNE